MTKSGRNEVSHYPEITSFIEAQLKSNLAAKGIQEIEIFWRIGELTSNIRSLVVEYPEKCACLERYSKTTPPLNLDVFGVITDGTRFEIIILEVKLTKGAGLSEWSQLLGYCVVSDAKYGLLINIDAGASMRLTGILSAEVDVSKVVRQKSNGLLIEHQLGFVEWNTITRNFEYSNLGQLWSVSAISEALAARFSSDQ